MENENTPIPGVTDQFVGNASRYGETDKSAVTKQEAALFNVQEASIAAMLVELLGCPAEKVTREATIESLGADSLDAVEIVMETEDRFNCEISDDEAEKVKTVADLFAIVKTATDHEADASIRPVR